MITKSKYPILEFDENQNAKLNLATSVKRKFETDKLISHFSLSL